MAIDKITNAPTPNEQIDKINEIIDNIPVVNNSTITFTQGGQTKGTITTNQSGDSTIALDAGSTITVDKALSTTSKNPVQNKVITNTLSGKVDTSSLKQVECVVDTYSNGTSWYRIWSDGWCEQGGRVTSAGASGTVTMIQSFASTNYTLLCQEGSTSDFGGTDKDVGGYADNIGVTNGTVNSFRYSVVAGRYFNWYACGYLYY